MSSPSLITTTNSSKLVNNKCTTGKALQLSPKTSGKDLSTCSRNHQVSLSKRISRAITSLKLTKNQVEVQPIIMSQHELLHNQPNSSSMISLDRIHQKNVHSEMIFEKSYIQASSIGYEPNNIFGSPKKLKNHRKQSEKYFNEEKKSYRGFQHLHALCLPYRKCHSSTEEKIVNVINKIKNGKECHKEIETLLQKCKKVSTKELSNRYFISGLYVIERLIQQSQQNLYLSQKIKQVILQLKARIIDQLDSISGFDSFIEPIRKPQFDKGILIRKAFKVLRIKKRETEQQILRKQAIKLTSQFLEQQPADLSLFWNQLRTL